MSLKKLFLNDTLVYGFSLYLNIFAALILTPIYTRTLSKEDYGIMDLCNVWNNFFIIIIPLGLTASIIRLYQDNNSNELNSSDNKKQDFLGTLFSFLLISNCIYLVLNILFKEFIINFYFKTNLDETIYYLSIFIVNFSVIVSYFQYLNRVRFKKYTYLIINVSSFLILSILGYILAIPYDYGIKGFFLASFISLFTSLILSLILVKDSIYFRLNLSLLKSSLKYALPLLFVIIFLKITFIIDRFIIYHFLDLETIGEYSIVLRISNIFQLIVSAFTTAWFPYAMNLIDNKNRNKIYKKTYFYFILLFTIVAFIIILFSKELLLFFAPAYLNIETIIYITVPTILVGGANYFCNLGIHITKKTHYLIYSAIISFFVNVISSVFLTNYFGIYGIALGSLIAVLTWVSIEYYFSYKVSKIKFNLSYMYISIILLILSGFLISLLNNSINESQSIFYIKCIFISIIFVIFLFNKKVRLVIKSFKLFQ